MDDAEEIEIKNHPFFQYMLDFNARRVVEEFYTAISKKKSVQGSPVIKILDAMIERNTFQSTCSSGTIFYRARSISTANDFSKGIIENKVGTFHGFDETNSAEPPMYRARAARANPEGVSYLYLAEDPYTACAEIRPLNNDYISIATFELVKPATLIDIRTNRSIKEFKDIEADINMPVKTIITGIMGRFSTPPSDKSVYASTQFITDYFRKAGFDGIRYQSSMTLGTNITLFNSHKSRIRFVDSKVVSVHSQHVNIIDLSNGDILKNPMHYEDETAYYKDSKETLSKILDRLKHRQ